jgi:CRISPR system Cascade subunit CasE
MMYLSRLVLNPRSRQVQREVIDPYQRHRTILAAFPEDLPKSECVLHRLEQGEGGNALILLVQSHHAPDWSQLEQKEYLTSPDPFSTHPNPAVKRFEVNLRTGQEFYFRLRANPTVKKKRPGQRNSNRVPLVREERQMEWLNKKSDQHGFKLLKTIVHNEINREGSIYRESGKRHKLTLYTVQFDGQLEVVDPARLEEAVRSGIGPAKAFGCGLLSLALVETWV